MQENPFADLSVRECHLVYPVLIENAERHLKAAIAVSKLEEYGVANSHLTICAEEYIKALSVYLKGWGLPAEKLKKMTKFFDTQEEGYAISPGIIILGLFAKSAFNVFEAVKKDIFGLSLPKLGKILNEGISPREMIAMSERYSKWWAEARILKEKGFYVQYNVEMTTPKDVTIRDYALSLEVILELKENTMGTIEFTKKIPKKQREAFLHWLTNSFQPLLERLNSFPFNMNIG